MNIKELAIKKKAQELILANKWEGEGQEEECFFNFSKECAIVAADEVINILSNIPGLDNEYYNIVKFYRDVKLEIERTPFD